MQCVEWQVLDRWDGKMARAWIECKHLFKVRIGYVLNRGLKVAPPVPEQLRAQTTNFDGAFINR